MGSGEDAIFAPLQADGAKNQMGDVTLLYIEDQNISIENTIHTGLLAVSCHIARLKYTKLGSICIKYQTKTDGPRKSFPQEAPESVHQAMALIWSTRIITSQDEPEGPWRNTEVVRRLGVAVRIVTRNFHKLPHPECNW